MELKNSTVLITGGTSGIGLEFAKQLTDLGANVIVTGRNPEALAKAKKQFPGLHTFQSDVGKPQDIEQLYAQVTQQFPDLNILINNAGIMRNLDLQDESLGLENITSEIDINLSGTIRMNHRFLPHLKKKKAAAIMNISSGIAFVPFTLSPIYSAAKVGVHAYTKVLRLQLKKTAVKVFELAPPATETTLMDAFSTDMDTSGGGRMMKTEKLVKAALDGLLSDKLEIKPGLAKALSFMGRVAPNFILNYMDRTIEKARAKRKGE